MAERSFYLIVRGWGSWGGGTPCHTYKAGVHEVSAQVAQAALAFKHTHPNASWLTISDTPPQLEDGSLIALQPDDLQPGVLPPGVRVLRDGEKPLSSPGDRNHAATAPPPGYTCEFCGDGFPSAAAAKRHLRHNHVLQPDKVEARVRGQLEAEREQRDANSRADAHTNSERRSSGSSR
jgi:hypothetical protein